MQSLGMHDFFADIGQIWPNPGRIWPGRIVPKWGRHLANSVASGVDTHTPDVLVRDRHHHIRAAFDQVWAEPASFATKSAPLRPNLAGHRHNVCGPRSVMWNAA